jgi:hypothetical protein
MGVSGSCLTDGVPTTITVRDLLGLRLRAHALTQSSALASPLEVTRRMLALQAQDFGGGSWAIGVRTTRPSRPALIDALAEGAIIRSWPMRGTLHFLAAEDLRWMLSVTGERMLASVLPRLARDGLDDQQLERAHDVAMAALSGGNALGRRDFVQRLTDAGVRTDGQLGYQVIYVLAQSGLICWGPPDRTQQALVLVDEWIAPAPRLERDDALRRMVLRYLAGHGPATQADFQWWTKSTVKDAARGFELARDDLTELTCAGESFWAVGEVLDASAPPSRVVALPGYDEYLLGPGYRRFALRPEDDGLLFSPKNGAFARSFIASGKVVAAWRGDGSVDAVGALSPSSAAGIERARKLYGTFAR